MTNNAVRVRTATGWQDIALQGPPGPVGPPGPQGPIGEVSQAQLDAMSLNVENFGASPTASNATNRTAIQAAINQAEASPATTRTIFFPRLYTIDSTPLVVKGHGLIFQGAGRTTSATPNSGAGIQTASGDLIQLGEPTTSVMGVWFRDLTLRSNPGGGHVLVVPSTDPNTGVAQGGGRNCYLLQANAGKSIWQQTNGLYLDMRWSESELEHVAAATVPAWNLRGPAGGFNTNTWERLRCTHSGNYFFHLEANTAGGLQYGNTFRDLNMEVCNGGGFKFLGCRDVLMEQVGFYDNTTITRDLVVFSRQTPGLYSQGCTLRHVTRYGGTLSANKDVRLDSTAVSTLSACGNQGGTQFTVANDYASGLTTQGMRDAKFETQGGPGYAWTNLNELSGVFKAEDGVVMRVKAGAPTDGDFPFALPPNGTVVIDTTNSKIYVRIGGVWKATAALA